MNNRGVRRLIEKWAPYFTEKRANIEEATKVCGTLSNLAEIIAEAHPRKFKGAIIWGEKRIGKSSYALQVAQQVYIALGCTPKEAWELAIASLFFHPRPLLETMRFINDNGCVWPLLILDDAGKAAGTHTWFTDRASYYALRDVFDTIGDPVSGFIATIPDFQNLLDVMKGDVSFYRVEITEIAGREWERRANAYRMKQLHSGKLRVQSKRSEKSGYKDRYSARLPDWQHAEYMKIRRKMTGSAIDFALERYEKGDKAKVKLQKTTGDVSPPGPQTPSPASPTGGDSSEQDEYPSSPPSPAGPGRKHLSKQA